MVVQTHWRTEAKIPGGGRRLRALRVLLGDPTPRAFSERIAGSPNTKSLTANAIEEIELPARPRQLWNYEAEAISGAVGVPYSYWTAPLARLGDVGE